jgi:hypothetical protein
VERISKLRIGIAGHRILAPQHDLDESIIKVCDFIHQVYPERTWLVYSSLAEGADCLFAQHALQYPGVELFIPLPLPDEEYLLDFHSEKAILIFKTLYGQASDIYQLPPTTNREEAYQAAGEYIVNSVDIMVAIWDGRKEHGAGGTGFVVRLAQQRHLPIAWIKAGNRRTGTLDPTHLGNLQGEVTFDGFPPSLYK